MAFITNADRDVAERTLQLIPTDIPQSRIEFDCGPSTAALASLLAALWITSWAGRYRGIDPGRPGVPEFGRKLYHLRLARRSRPVYSARLTPREAAAITRKSGLSVDRLISDGSLDHWQNSLNDFLARLRAARFVGIALDYDGTLVDARRRLEPADSEIVDQLIRITEAGTHIAIATGRGASVRRDLQACLPRPLWPLVLVGYYNGAETALLADGRAPNKAAPLCSTLQPLADALRRQPQLSTLVRQEDRPFQITLEAVRPTPVHRIWDLAWDVVRSSGVVTISVTRSSHSIDITPDTVSKLNVVHSLRRTAGPGPVLAIGDQGRWPGNDHELLGGPFALSVDEVTSHPGTCWHLGEPGQRGPAVTLEYLSQLRSDNGYLRFADEPLR